MYDHGIVLRVVSKAWHLHWTHIKRKSAAFSKTIAQNTAKGQSIGLQKRSCLIIVSTLYRKNPSSWSKDHHMGEKQYCWRPFFCIIGNIDCEKKTIYNIDALTALCWICTEWESYSTVTIKSSVFPCFWQDGKFAVNLERLMIMKRSGVQINQNSAKNGLTFMQIDMNALINPEDEDGVVSLLILRSCVALISVL